MALGSNNNQNNKGLYEPTYYSRLRFKNDDDKLQVGFSYWKGTLKLAITEKSNGDNQKSDEIAYIHLSPVKAKMFANYVQMVIENPTSSEIYGVNTGASDVQGLLVISRDNGRPYIIVAKVNKDGSFANSQRFNFNYNYHYGLKFEDLNKLSFSKEYDDNLELIQFKEILEDYARSASGAIGATCWDVARYEVAKMNNLINQIADKVGVERKTGGSYNNSGSAGDSYFANNGKSSSGGFSGMNKPSSSGYSTGSIDELDAEFE